MWPSGGKGGLLTKLTPYLRVLTNTLNPADVYLYNTTDVTLEHICIKIQLKICIQPHERGGNTKRILHFGGTKSAFLTNKI